MKKEIWNFQLKDISEDSEIKETAIIKIQKNDYFYDDKKINKNKLEEELVIITNNKKFKNFVILNDKSSEIKSLIYILDILKKNKIKNVSFANDPKEKSKIKKSFNDSINLIPMINLIFLLLIFFS